MGAEHGSPLGGRRPRRRLGHLGHVPGDGARNPLEAQRLARPRLTRGIHAGVRACLRRDGRAAASGARGGLPAPLADRPTQYIGVHVRRGDKASLYGANATEQARVNARADARLVALVDYLLAAGRQEVARADFWTVVSDDADARAHLVAHLAARGVVTREAPSTQDGKVAPLLDFATLEGASLVVSSTVSSRDDDQVDSYSAFSYMASRFGGSHLYSTARYADTACGGAPPSRASPSSRCRTRCR